MNCFEALNKIRNTSFDDVDINEIPDIRELEINTSLPKEKRIEQLLTAGFNPYVVRCGKTKIKISYIETDKRLEDVLENLIETTMD